MISIDEQLQGMKENALRRGVLVFAIFATPTALFSIARAIGGDWHPLFTLQTILLVFLLITAALRNSLSLSVLGGIVITLSSCVGLAGMYTYGAIAPAGHWFIAIAIFFAGMLYAARGMLVIAFVLLGSMLIIAWLHLTGSVTPFVRPAEFVVARSSWLVEWMCAGVFVAIVLPTARNFVEASQRWMLDYQGRREKIAHLAMHDELTGLPRLRAAQDRLSVGCNRCRRSGGMLAVLFIDLDGFKQVNDTYGHEAGDTCLRAVAERLQGRLREQDTVARAGGDEFIVILENVSSESAAEGLAVELIALIRRPVDFEIGPLHIGASIGVAMCPQNGDDVTGLLRHADAAMYRSKRAGGNGVLFAEGEASSESADETDNSAEDENDASLATADATPQHSMRKTLLEAIVDSCILVLSVAISLTILANVWRIAFNQSAPNIGPTLVALAVVLVLFLAKNYIALRDKIALTTSIGLLIALPGLFVVGLAGPAIGWALASALFLVGIFYYRPLCIAAAIIVLLAIMLSGLGFVSGTLVSQFDVNEQALHPSRWLVFLLAAMAYTSMVLSTWWQHQRTTSRLIEQSTEQIAELVKLATIDEMTGLPLLRLANDRLDMACSRAQRANARAGLLLIDLDGFKSINDRFGHDAGDYCLREIANRMTASLRASDTTARIGGDEFLVILDTVAEFEQVSATARRLIENISRPMDFGGRQFSVGASIGIALYPDHATQANELRQRADAAMYAAKLAGKGRHEFAV